MKQANGGCQRGALCRSGLQGPCKAGAVLGSLGRTKSPSLSLAKGRATDERDRGEVGMESKRDGCALCVSSVHTQVLLL